MPMLILPLTALSLSTITASDKDGIVGDGKTVTFTATVDRSDDPAANVEATVSVEIAPYPGTQGESEDIASTPDDIHDAMVAEITFPRGTPNGEYTVTVTVDPGDEGGDAVPFVFTLENSEPGTPLASASIGFGKYTPTDLGADDAIGGTGENADTPATCAAPGATESADGASVKYDTPICLQVTALNSLGNPAQDEDIKEIIVSAPTGMVDGLENSKSFIEDENADPATPSPGSTQYFRIERKTAGTVDVSVLVIGAGTAGFANAGSLMLTFSGDPESISLDAPSSPLAKSGNQSVVAVDGVDANDDDDFDDNGDTAPVAKKDLVGATVKVTAKDSSGNNAVLEPADLTSLSVADANGMATDKVKAMAKKIGTPETTTIEVWSEGADPGTYTLTVKLGTKDKQTVDVVVAGDAASVSLTAEWNEAMDTVTATATVTDKADGTGNPVPDATTVTFEAIGGLDLRARSGVGVTKSNDGKSASINTNDGVAVMRFSPIAESGLARIFASVPGADDVANIAIEAEADAMPEEEASLSCLSSLSGFSTWTCDVEASASEIFGWISSRGATALHLNSNRMWVRYSVVDGAMVPGSSDFMVTKSDILYISN